MEVQRKLHEQIEVQKHLQQRIEAQGKYLQSVLMKAQETLARYGSSDELAKAELSQSVSMLNKCCPSSSLSAITKIDGSILKDTDRNSPSSSMSTLTKIDDSITKEVGTWKRNSSILSLMDMNPGNGSGSNAEAKINKRSRTNIWTEQPSGKIRDTQRTNEQFASGPEVIDFISRCF
ncbi:PREDICTED: myb family transcription factor PHL8-like [Nicotiana attenuata]|nr:PREDICTED: myb family transcription factor PHL8-like [Nicotiana attenuata]